MSGSTRISLPVAYKPSTHMSFSYGSYKSDYMRYGSPSTASTSNYSSRIGRQNRNASIKGSSGMLYPTASYGSASSKTTSLVPMPPSGRRPLPSGPGPLDKYGNKQDYGTVKSRINSRTSATSSNSSIGGTKPLKADHNVTATPPYTTGRTRTNTYDSTKYTDTYITRRHLNRETLPPPGSLRNRTSSHQDVNSVGKKLDYLELDEKSSSGSLQRSSKYGSMSDVVGKSRRTNYGSDYGNDYDSVKHTDNLYNTSSSYLRSSERDDSNSTDRLTARLTAKKEFSPDRLGSGREILRTDKDRSKDSDSESVHENSPPAKYASRKNSDSSEVVDNNNNLHLGDYREKLGRVGLKNLGNTCFMNSVLQCLSNTRPLLEYFLNRDYQSDINRKTSSMKGSLIKAYAELMVNMWCKSASSCVSPSLFKSQIQRFAARFVGYNQQDAQEFLRYLLEGLHEDVNRVQSKPKPIPVNEAEEDKLSDTEKSHRSWKCYMNFDDSRIVDIFVGQLKSTLSCTSCGYQSVTFDPFWDLSVPVPKKYGDVSIDECLALFMKEEVLDGDERPKCERCKTHQKCTKGFSIQKFPKILVLHLKRFSGERYRSKLGSHVDYPVKDLNLSKFAAEKGNHSNCMYNLYGVSNHSGSVYSGHYTAYCKHPYSGQWLSFNDSHCRNVSSRSVVSSEGYVLFYELNKVKESRL